MTVWVTACRGHPGLRAQVVGQPDQLADPAADAGGPRGDRRCGQDAAGQVGQGSPHVFVPDIEAEHVARFRADLVEPGRPPGHPGPLPGHPDQAGPLHRGQRQRDGRLGQPGQPGQVRAGERAQVPDVAEQQLLVHGPDERGTRRGQRAGHAGRCAIQPQAPRHPARQPIVTVTATSRIIVPHHCGNRPHHRGNRPPPPQEPPPPRPRERPASGTGPAQPGQH